jgi:hypothetical protein
MDELEEQFRSAVGFGSRTPLSYSKPPTRRQSGQSRQPRLSTERARPEILQAWRSWAKANRVIGTANDNDAHRFLRDLKISRPDLLKFQVKGSSYERAFNWLVAAGFIHG